MMTRTTLTLIGSLALGLSAMTTAQAAVDTAAAEALFKGNKCNKCHDVKKDKTGPSFATISGKYKGKADGEASVIKNITTGSKIKVNGEDQEHVIIKTKDPAELKNLAQWILSH